MIKDDTHLLYLMPEPFGNSDCKVGITRLEVSQIRAGTYQQALGPNQLMKWQHAWIGKENAIKELEAEVKKDFRKKILYEGRGYSEWICEHYADEMEKAVIEIINGLRSKVIAVDKAFLPITVNNIEEVKTKYLPNVE
tara:strand:- start:347 stop:760 length:414 start_codon:yes stop_codon:yes gene_type:complete